LTAAEVYGYSI